MAKEKKIKMATMSSEVSDREYGMSLIHSGEVLDDGLIVLLS